MRRGGSDGSPEVSVTIRGLRPGLNQAAAWKKLWERLLTPIKTDAAEDAHGQGSSEVDTQRSSGDH
jgi:hypothetical protein